MCPAGTVLYGTGATISEGFGEVGLEALVPDGSPPSSVNIVAIRSGAFAGNWSLRGFAICGAPQPDVRFVYAVSAFDSTSPKTVDVFCPAGLSTHGIAAKISGGLGDVGSWSLTTFAICAT